MIKLKVLLPHENEFGEQREKKKNDTYEAPAGAAQALVANGYAADIDGALKKEG